MVSETSPAPASCSASERAELQVQGRVVSFQLLYRDRAVGSSAVPEITPEVSVSVFAQEESFCPW